MCGGALRQRVVEIAAAVFIVVPLGTILSYGLYSAFVASVFLGGLLTLLVVGVALAFVADLENM